MSFTMAWNNPPSAPHSFSTDSMVSKTNKKSSQKDEYQTKYSTVAVSNIGRVDLCFLHPSFEVLPYNDVACSEEDARTHSPQPAARGAHRQKEMCCSVSPGAPARSAAGTRLSVAQEGWSRGALFCQVGLQLCNVEGTCTVASHDHRLNTNNGESTTLGKRARGGGGRAGGGGTTGSVATDAGTRSVVNSGADVLELEAPVIRSMGMERGLVKCVFFCLNRRRGQGGTPIPPSTPTQTKVKPCLLSEQLPNTQSRISSGFNVYSHTCLFMIVEPLSVGLSRFRKQ